MEKEDYPRILHQYENEWQTNEKDQMIQNGLSKSLIPLFLTDKATKC